MDDSVPSEPRAGRDRPREIEPPSETPRRRVLAHVSASPRLCGRFSSSRLTRRAMSSEPRAGRGAPPEVEPPAEVQRCRDLAHTSASPRLRTRFSSKPIPTAAAVASQNALQAACPHAVHGAEPMRGGGLENRQRGHIRSLDNWVAVSGNDPCSAAEPHGFRVRCCDLDLKTILAEGKLAEAATWKNECHRPSDPSCAGTGWSGRRVACPGISGACADHALSREAASSIDGFSKALA